MNNRSTMQKKFGIIALIGAMLQGTQKMPEGTTHQELSQRRNFILTNGGIAPIPNKVLNQRQRRKRNRQTQNFK